MTTEFGDDGERWPEFIFPVVELAQVGTSSVTRRRFLGNGCFIGPDGLFLTATHLLGEWDHFAGDFVVNEAVRVWEGTRSGGFHEAPLAGLSYRKRDGDREGEPVADVAVAILADAHFERAVYAFVTTRISRPGESVYCVGYPESEVAGRHLDDQPPGPGALTLDLGPESFSQPTKPR